LDHTEATIKVCLDREPNIEYFGTTPSGYLAYGYGPWSGAMH